MSMDQEIQKKQKRKKESARKLQNARKDIIDLFEKGIFPYKGNVFKTKQEEKQKETKDDAIALNKWIIDEEENINKGLFTKHFKIQSPSEMFKSIYQTNDKEKTINQWM